MLFPLLSMKFDAISSCLLWFQSQEAMLDSLYWNATLRLDPTAISTAVAVKPTVETDLVCSQGLVALSLNGNCITDIGIGFVRRAVKSNHWILGELVIDCFYSITSNVYCTDNCIEECCVN